MSYRLQIQPTAEADVDQVAVFIAKDSVERALRFYDSVEVTYRTILEYPERWPEFESDHPALAGVRKLAVHRYSKFLVFYQIKQRTVRIIRVIHGARDLASVLLED